MAQDPKQFLAQLEACEQEKKLNIITTLLTMLESATAVQQQADMYKKIAEERNEEIVNLKVIGEQTFERIAAILQLPLGTVTWRYRQAITKLRRCGYEA